MKLLEIITKNFRILFRSKISAFIILFGPFFILLILGMAFDTTGLQNIIIGSYTEKASPVSDELLDRLNNTKFHLVEFDSKYDCIDSVKESTTNICISFPENLTVENMNRTITFHVDYSRLNLVYAILNFVSSQVQNKSSELRFEYTEELLNQVASLGDELSERTTSIENIADEARLISDKVEEIESQIDSLEIDSGIDIETLKLDLKSGDVQIDAYLSEMNSVLDDGLTTIEEFEVTIDATEEIIEDNKDLFESYEDEIALIEATICIDESSLECITIRSVQAQFNDTLDELDTILVSLEVARDELGTVESQIKNLQYQQTEAQSLLDENIYQFNKELGSAEDKVDELESLKDDLKKDISDILATIEKNIKEIDTTVTSVTDLTESVEDTSSVDAENIVNPIKTDIHPVTKNDKSYITYMLPALLVLIIMFMSILLSSTIVMSEKKSKAYFRNYITPVSDLLFISATFLTNMIIIAFQTTILLVLAYFLNINLFPNIHNIGLALALVASLFILFGMIIGYLFNSEETATLVAVSVCCILLLFSSIVVPIESLESYIAFIAQFNPFFLAERLINKMILLGATFLDQLYYAQILGLYVAATAVALYIVEKLDKRRIR